MSVTCSRPSMPPRSTNAPYSVMFLTVPSRMTPSSSTLSVSLLSAVRSRSSTERRETTTLPRERLNLRIAKRPRGPHVGVRAGEERGHADVDLEPALHLADDRTLDRAFRLERALDVAPHDE